MKFYFARVGSGSTRYRVVYFESKMYGRFSGTRGETRRAAAEAENAIVGRVRRWDKKVCVAPLAPHVTIKVWVPGERPTKPLSPVKFCPRDEELPLSKEIPIEKPRDDDKMVDVDAVEPAKQSAAAAPPDAMEGVVDAKTTEAGAAKETEKQEHDEITPQDPMETVEDTVTEAKENGASPTAPSASPAPVLCDVKVQNGVDADTDATMKTIPAVNGDITEDDNNANDTGNSNNESNDNNNNDSNGLDGGNSSAKREDDVGRSEGQEVEKDQVAPMDDVAAAAVEKPQANEGASDENKNENANDSTDVTVPVPSPAPIPSTEAGIEKEETSVVRTEVQASKEEKVPGEERDTAAEPDQGITIGEEEAPMEEAPTEEALVEEPQPQPPVEVAPTEALAVPAAADNSNKDSSVAQVPVDGSAPEAETSQGPGIPDGTGAIPSGDDGMVAEAAARPEAEEGEI